MTQIVSSALPPHHAFSPIPEGTPLSAPDFLHLFNRSVGQLDLKDGAIRLLELLLSYDLPDPRNGQERKGFVWPSRKTGAVRIRVKNTHFPRRLLCWKGTETYAKE